MYRFFPYIPILSLIYAGLFYLPCSLLAQSSNGSNPGNLTLSQLEDELEEIDSSLKSLAHYSPRSGIGAIGFRSLWHTEGDIVEWVKVEFDQEYPIDEIALVPTIWRDTERGFRGDAFPSGFRVIAGTANGQSTVSEFTYPEESIQRLAPLVIPLYGVTASWIRIESKQLTQRAFDNYYVFQLSEFMVFSGTENIALRRPIEASSNQTEPSRSWDKRFLVDGFTPYLMNSSLGNQSVAYVSLIGDRPSLSLDLQSEYPISRIHLHSVDQSDTVPQAYAGDLGIPQHILIEGANEPDFSDSTTLLDYKRESINDNGPIMMWRISETSCRYVRISAKENQLVMDPDSPHFRIGFAEIELFANGVNVALGKQLLEGTEPKPSGRDASALTDGNNLYGKILPIRDWLNELAQRYDLETRRPKIIAELTLRYAQQKTNLIRVSWLAGLLAVGICITIIIDRFIQMRQMARMKDRFAADLHDELGANLHTIGILSDLAKDSINSPDELILILDQVRLFTQRSGTAARNCTNMLEAKGICEDLVEAMNRSSSRLLADLEHTIGYHGEEELKKLKPRKRIDLFFFYKECLTNIIRHSGATKVTTLLNATSKSIELTITDNGKGISASLDNAQIPPSLKRRAKLLGAKVSTLPVDEGTRINLRLKTNRFWIRK